MSANKKKLYSIGEIANLLGVSTSSLRFYDEAKIIVPMIRDDNGYRYYTDTQVMELMFILEMRRIDIPLNNIKKMLGEKELFFVRKNIESRIGEIEQEILKLHFQKEYAVQLTKQLNKGIRNIFKTNKDTKCDDLSINYYPAVNAVTLDTEGSFIEQEKFTTAHIRLNNICEEKHLNISGCPMVYFKDDGKQHLYMKKYKETWALPVNQNSGCCDQVVLFPDYWGASIIHIGSYDSMEDSYCRLLDNIEKEHLKLLGPPIEQYIINCMHIIDSSQFVTKIIFPLNQDSLKHEFMKLEHNQNED
jgi:DNA-binding transcriptional MerR regulator